MFSPADEAVVAVPVATLWTAPTAVRPLDAPTLGPAPDLAGWVAAMGADGRADLTGRTLTQLLLGERVWVEEVAADWARVVAVEQPAGKLHGQGYPGWLPLAQLAPVGAVPAGQAVLVDAVTTALHGPGGQLALRGVTLGTRLPLLGGEVGGDVGDGWLPVAVPGRAGPLWARAGDVVAAPVDPGTAADPALDTATPPAATAPGGGRATTPAGPGGDVVTAGLVPLAERLLGVPYVWGGLSPHGIDCSGLVHLACRRLGLTLPRDADDQAAATEPLRLGEERPGDLYFFARADGRIFHVGVVDAPGADGRRRMVHACGVQGRVVSEAVTGDRAATLVAAHRIPR